MTSAPVAMVTGWSKEASRRCARPELDPDEPIGLRLVVALAFGQRTSLPRHVLGTVLGSELVSQSPSCQGWGRRPLCAP